MYIYMQILYLMECKFQMKVKILLGRQYITLHKDESFFYTSGFKITLEIMEMLFHL